MDTSTFLRPLGISERQLQFLGRELSTGARYTKRRLRKRHGGYRTIAVPDLELRATLKLLRMRLELALPYEPPEMVFGYVAGRSIVDNAAHHLGQEVVVCVDLLDYFGSIDSTRLMAALTAQGLTTDLVQLLIPVLTVEDSLPPGFSTSPMLSNVVFEETDRALAALAEELGIRYSRYADDLTFSGELISDALLERVDEVLRERGWSLNPRKSRFMRRGGPQYVTGLYIGDPLRPHVPRRVKRRLRAWFHYINKYGYEDCQAMVPLPTPRQLEGWLRHVNQVNPEIVQAIIKGLGHDDLAAAIERLGLDLKGPLVDDWDDLLRDLDL